MMNKNKLLKLLKDHGHTIISSSDIKIASSKQISDSNVSYFASGSSIFIEIELDVNRITFGLSYANVMGMLPIYEVLGYRIPIPKDTNGNKDFEPFFKKITNVMAERFFV